jgi:hypothetical protein
MRLRVTVCLGLFAFALLAGTSAFADDLQIVCTGTTTCAAGGIQTTASTTPTFDVTFSGNATGGTLWIAILDPSTSGSFTGPANNTLWNSLGLNGGSDHNFASTVSQDNSTSTHYFTGADNSFTVTAFDTHESLTSKMTDVVTLPPGSYAAGTIFVAYTLNADGVITDDSPWSESLLITDNGGGGGGTSVPEPSTGLLILLGTIGLAGLAALRKL